MLEEKMEALFGPTTDGSAAVAAAPRPLPSWLAPRPMRAEPESGVEAMDLLDGEAILARVDFAPPPAVPLELLSSVTPPAAPSQAAAPISHTRVSVAPRPIEEPSVEETLLRQENDALRRTLVAALDALARARQQLMESSEPEMVKLACAVAERIVGRELTTDPALVVGWVHEAAAAMGTREEVTIVCGAHFAAMMPEGALGAFDMTVDGALAPDACEVRTDVSTTVVSAATRASAVVDHVTGRS